MISIHERLSVFDGWLTIRIAEAHAGRKDLAFRDLEAGERGAGSFWEYSLLEPGGRSPQGEGWSVYRLNSVSPAQPPGSPVEMAGSEPAEPRSLLHAITAAVLGRAPRRR